MAKVAVYIVLGLVALVAAVSTVNGAGECGANTPDQEAMKLEPCVPAGRDASIPVPQICCDNVKQMMTEDNQACACAVLNSDTAKSYQKMMDPIISMTIPKRCNFPDDFGKNLMNCQSSPAQP